MSASSGRFFVSALFRSNIIKPPLTSNFSIDFNYSKLQNKIYFTIKQIK